MLHLTRLTTRKIAMIAVLSALYYVMSFLPGIKVAIGAATPVTIQIEALFASIFGLIMGPYLGSLTALMGAFIAWSLPPGSPSLTSAIFLPCPVMNAFTVGLIYRGKWKIAAASLAFIILVFWFLPVTQPWSQNFYVGVFAMWDKIGALLLILTSNFFKSDKSSKNNLDTNGEKKKADVTTIFLTTAAVLLLINSWVIVAYGNPKYQFEVFGATLKFNLVTKDFLPLVSSVGYGWFLLGVGILICIVLTYIRPEKRMLWNITALMLSCLSAVIGGGYIVGLILGVLGSMLGLLTKEASYIRRSLFGDLGGFFILAFIGNEADNALGNLIFGLPPVYEGLFLMSTEALRLSFITLPFFYFSIRFLQAAITAFIATPLLRNLRSAGFLDFVKDDVHEKKRSGEKSQVKSLP
ncbi:MAG: hypothetical protein QW279_06885 [Candidatus Jordarchaeaceae archaeon]